jgi:hypothetical protein
METTTTLADDLGIVVYIYAFLFIYDPTSAARRRNERGR